MYVYRKYTLANINVDTHTHTHRIAGKAQSVLDAVVSGLPK